LAKHFPCKVGHSSDSIHALKHEIMKRIRFPITIKRGSSSVKIYRDRKVGGTYYRVVYHLGRKRHRLHFVDLGRARIEAEAKAAQLSRGDIDATQLNGRDRLEFGRARAALGKIPLDAVAIEYSEAKKILAGGTTLLDAARFYARHHGATSRRIAVADAAQAMLDHKQRKGVSDVYVTDLRYRLRAFAGAFHCDVSALVPDDVHAFLESLGQSPRSYNNSLRTLRMFFRFSQRHGWLSKEIDLLERVESRRETAKPVTIFTPSELTALLGNAEREITPALALGAFAGLRTAEILRLEWSDLERHPGYIEVAAAKAKTATRRIVPIPENLARWLCSTPRVQERVWPRSRDGFFRSMRRTALTAKVPWRANALRHSFISYRLAEIQDVNRVALEAGNSPAMIFRHYRELCTPEQAQTWFSIAPAEAQNVVAMTRAHHG
jgi:site-specific recombinase XerD